jgi:trk system potassium uptake protein TrkA
MGRYVVVGLGNFGISVARTLERMGHEVIVIERDGVLVDRHAEWVSRAVEGDASDPVVLRGAGVSGADGAVISTGESLATSILATVALRDLGVKEIFVKVGNETEARALNSLGVTEAIIPEQEAGERLAHRLVSQRVLLDYQPLCEDHSIQEMAAPPSWVGKSLRTVAAREKEAVQVIAVRDALTGGMAIPPDPDALLKDSDSLVVAGADADLERLQRRKR